ncbi:MAG TPA: hypothetical protein VFO55_01060 [Gemmatimonadaceae bacterium]|nr:hypothetical protein [Gemmatimonadaceae bacterium]
MHGKNLITLVATLAVVAGCATGGGSDPMPGPTTSAANAPVGWPIRTAQHVDLWWHGYALLINDTSKVPLFDRGYRERMLDLRRQRNVVTALDANRQALQDGLARNPDLGNGQFAIFSFASFDEVLRVVPLFVRNEGSPSTVNDPTMQQLFLTLRNYYRTVADREWLRLFTASLQDEQNRFYGSYWNAQQVDRAPVRRAVETAWTNTYRAKFQRFLRNERLIDGTFILSLPLGGEGRALISAAQGNGIAVPLPESTTDAMASIYVFAHEAAGGVSSRAIEDNLTPAEARAGAAAKFTPIAAVRGGAILLQRIAPELVTGYQRYYLRQTGAAVPSGDPNAAFLAAYAIPEAVATGIARQIDLILAGI